MENEQAREIAPPLETAIGRPERRRAYDEWLMSLRTGDLVTTVLPTGCRVQEGVPIIIPDEPSHVILVDDYETGEQTAYDRTTGIRVFSSGPVWSLVAPSKNEETYGRFRIRVRELEGVDWKRFDTVAIEAIHAAVEAEARLAKKEVPPGGRLWKYLEIPLRVLLAHAGDAGVKVADLDSAMRYMETTYITLLAQRAERVRAMNYCVVELHPNGTHTCKFWSSLDYVASQYDLGGYRLDRMNGSRPAFSRADIWDAGGLPRLFIFNTDDWEWHFNKRAGRWGVREKVHSVRAQG